MGTGMELSFKEQVKVILDRNKMTMAKLAKLLDISKQNLHNKFARDNFTEKEMEQIACAMGFKLNISFIPSDTDDAVKKGGD